MRYFKILLCTAFLSLSFCKESPKVVTIEQDKIQIDLKKEIATLEADRKFINEKNEVVTSKINDKTSNQKFNDLLRKQRYANNRFLDSIEQNVNYLKIKSLGREKFYLDKSGSQSEADMIKQFEEYSLNNKVNPPSYPWRKLNITLPGDKNKAASPAHGETPAHGEKPPTHGEAEAKPAAHGGGHH